MDGLDKLDAIARQADIGLTDIDNPGQAEQEQQQAQQQASYATEAAGLVDMFAAIVVGFAPECAPLWDAGTKTRIAKAAAPVMEKYGFSMGGMPCEITLIIVAGPTLYQTSKLLAEKMAEAKKPKKAADITDVTVTDGNG